MSPSPSALGLEALVSPLTLEEFAAQHGIKLSALYKRSEGQSGFLTSRTDPASPPARPPAPDPPPRPYR